MHNELDYNNILFITSSNQYKQSTELQIIKWNFELHINFFLRRRIQTRQG